MGREAFRGKEGILEIMLSLLDSFHSMPCVLASERPRRDAMKQVLGRSHEKCVRLAQLDY
jgi:hypothetical protein